MKPDRAHRHARCGVEAPGFPVLPMIAAARERNQSGFFSIY
jgi:hypothetical protein